MHRSATEFSIAWWRAYEDQVLGRGSVTLPLLRELHEEWIAAAPAPPLSAR